MKRASIDALADRTIAVLLTNLEVFPRTRPSATDLPTDVDLDVLFVRIIVSCTTETGEIPPPKRSNPQI
jgi:hypothetical protein